METKYRTPRGLHGRLGCRLRGGVHLRREPWDEGASETGGACAAAGWNGKADETEVLA